MIKVTAHKPIMWNFTNQEEHGSHAKCMPEQLTRHRMETREISTDRVSLSWVFMAEAARPVGTDWSGMVAMVMGVAGGTLGTGPTTLFNVLSTKDTMDKT